MKIGINCGHTISKQPGCGAVGIIDESVETRTIGKALITKLKTMGHTVVDCTNDYAASTNENLSKICKLANSQKLDMFVSIHFNAGKGKGTEVYTYSGTKHTEALNICENISKLGFMNRGVKNGSNLYVIRNTNAKAMLIEVCFVDTKSDVDLYKANISNIVNSIAEGITGEKVSKENEVLNMTQYEELKSIIKGLSDRLEKVEKPMIYNYIDVNMPEYARQTIQKLMDKGYLKGDSSGNLNLTDEMLRTLVILDRSGSFDK